MATRKTAKKRTTKARSKATSTTTTTRTATRPSPTKKAPTKKATAKTTAAKKAPTKKTTAKKALSKRAAAPSNKAKPTTIDEYLSQIDVQTRALLQQLRQTIHELVPEVTECISYSLPAFRYQGKVIAGFIATKAGASYLPFSGTTLGTLARELAGHSQTKSSLHFTAQQPLPKSLVNTLLQTRIAEL